MKYLSAVPTTFDETKVLDAKLGGYILLAKRNGKSWYVAATTSWKGRDLKIDFPFFPQM